MIKYLELTAPEKSEFRQAKIISVEVSEGSTVKEGDTLFKVKSGENEIDLPSSLEGKVVELIANEGENITIMTPLLLLETEVESSTATPPITEPSAKDEEPASAMSDEKTQEHTDLAKSRAIKTESTKKKKKQTKKEKKAAAEKAHQQQSLDLDDSLQSKESKSKPISSESKSSKQESEPIDQAQSISEPQSPEQKIMAENKSPQTQNSSSNVVSVSVPDIGTDTAKVIEILVSEGEKINIEDPIVTLESDKASMDVPSSHTGTITAIKVKVDDDVSEGHLLIEIASDSSDQNDDAKSENTENKTDAPSSISQASVDDSPSNPIEAPANSSASEPIEVKVPDIGGDSAKVIEILVSEGDQVDIEDSLITLESDKASMDVPSSAAGTIETIHVEMDQEISEGDLIVTLKGVNQSSAMTQKIAANNNQAQSQNKASDGADQATQKTASQSTSAAPIAKENKEKDAAAHASPSVRRFARELGASLGSINGSGRKGRITKDDVKAHVKQAMTSKPSAPQSEGSGIPAIPSVDFSKFGEIETQALNKIKRLTAANLHRSWLNVPHVTHNDESDISDLEAFRKQLNKEYAEKNRDVKLSPLAFIVKAVVNALQTYPQFNSSLDPSGEHLILKKYFNIGIAVDTPNGLVVPVVKGADKMSVADIAREMGELAAKARDKKLTMADMSGACITISSLGGIGGTSFTPIVNAPEVAILGVSRSKMSPVWNGSEFEAKMILPLSLSYDHRVIDGAEAARFARHIATVLEDVRRLVV